MDALTSCPACGSDEILPHLPIACKSGCDKVLSPGEPARAGKWAMSECGRCRHVFVNPPAYEAHAYKAAPADPDIHPWCFADRRAYLALTLKEILSITGRRRLRILDFGCGYGTTASIFADMGHDAVGYDVSQEQVTYASEHFGVEAHSGGWEAVRERIGQVDAIFSQNVFEHLDRPYETLLSMQEVLRPGGALSIVVPNFARRGEGYNPPEHLHYFTRASIRELVTRSRCRIRHVRFGLPAVTKLYRVCGRIGPLAAVRAIDRITALAGLSGYNLAVCGQKRDEIDRLTGSA